MKKKLAWFDKPKMQGKIRIHPAVRRFSDTKCKLHPNMEQRIKKHMVVAQKVYKETGNRQQAIKAGLKAEHLHMSPQQRQNYDLATARIAKKIKGG